MTHASTRAHVLGLIEALSGADAAATTAERWGGRLYGLLSAGHRLLAVGNGGSAAQAQHLTAELVGRYHHDRPPFSALCLSAETSSLTAIINDYPPEELFARQVEAHGRAGDVLVAFSTSGTSPNIVAAARRAHDLGLQVWGVTGSPDCPLAQLAHEAATVDAESTATVQEVHLVLLHLICEAFDEAHASLMATAAPSAAVSA